MPETVELEERLRALTVLWRRALSGPLHAAGCSCSGGFLLGPPSATALEEDVLDYLRHRYTGEQDVTDPLLAREAVLRSGAAPDFPQFLRALTAALPGSASDRLLTDLGVTLLSLAGPAAGSSRFACL